MEMAARSLGTSIDFFAIKMNTNTFACQAGQLLRDVLEKTTRSP